MKLPTMSQPSAPNTTQGNDDLEYEEGITFADAILLIGVAVILIAMPMLGYFFGALFGTHLQLSDVSQGFTSGAVVYTVYNVTHNPIFAQESQVLVAMGINTGNQDINTSEMIGLSGGAFADFLVIWAFRDVLRKVSLRRRK